MSISTPELSQFNVTAPLLEEEEVIRFFLFNSYPLEALLRLFQN
jgi:hypothetical protein